MVLAIDPIQGFLQPQDQISLLRDLQLLFIDDLLILLHPLVRYLALLRLIVLLQLLTFHLQLPVELNALPQLHFQLVRLLPINLPELALQILVLPLQLLELYFKL